jgi:hypothetical protein
MVPKLEIDMTNIRLGQQANTPETNLLEQLPCCRRFSQGHSQTRVFKEDLYLASDTVPLYRTVVAQI